MNSLDPNLIGLIHMYYKEASRYLKAYGPYLNKKDRITLNEFPKVVTAVERFLEFCGNMSTTDRNKLIDLIFDLHRCRNEEIEKETGAHDAHLGAIKFFDTAANAVKFAMTEEDEFADSPDIKALYRWFRSVAPNPEVIEEYKGYQPTSKYSDLIFQIVSMTRMIKKRSRVKGMYAAIDNLLFGVYPKGLRRSRNLGALDEAYKEGRNRVIP